MMGHLFGGDMARGGSGARGAVEIAVIRGVSIFSQLSWRIRDVVWRIWVGVFRIEATGGRLSARVGLVGRFSWR